MKPLSIHPKHAELIGELTEYVTKIFKENLVSLIVEGSFATREEILHVSDLDLVIVVRKPSKTTSLDFKKISKESGYHVSYVVKQYSDFQNRVKNNRSANRYFTNLYLWTLKHRAVVVRGKDILKEIPSDAVMRDRDMAADLRARYLFATNMDEQWNILMSPPHIWPGFIINTANSLLWAKGVFVSKEYSVRELKKHHPKFHGTGPTNRAVRMRTKLNRQLNKKEILTQKEDLKFFLKAYKDYVFSGELKL